MPGTNDVISLRSRDFEKTVKVHVNKVCVQQVPLNSNLQVIVIYQVLSGVNLIRIGQEIFLRDSQN